MEKALIKPNLICKNKFNSKWNEFQFTFSLQKLFRNRNVAQVTGRSSIELGQQGFERISFLGERGEKAKGEIED